VVLQRDCDAPVAHGALEVSRVRVCVYEQMLQLYPDERCQKKKP